jgi:hypothetical protein
MSAAQHAVTVADDEALAEMIIGAQRRLIIIAPGLSTVLAIVLAERWAELGKDAVSVTLDVDPEVCRMGFGTIEAVRLLQETAGTLGTTLNTHPGIRIGVVISDDQTLIFAPTPLNIEAGPKSGPQAPLMPNAIRVGLPPADLERDLGAGPEGVKDQIVGLDPVSPHQLEKVEEELKAVPPQPVNISRMLRVFTAQIQFVELRLEGCMVARKVIDIPSDLVGLADERTRRLLESKFRLIDQADADVWGEELRRIKDFIVKRFLVHLPTYGHVLRMKDKAKFERAVRTLEKMLHRARKRKCGKLQQAIDRRVNLLQCALAPAVKAHPPLRWHERLERRTPVEMLECELKELAGTAQQMLEDAKVEVRYKGVTYETLNDPGFVALVRERISDLAVLYEEMDAAPVVPPSA